MRNRDDILAMLRQVKYDLSVTQTRIGEAIEAVAAMPAPKPTSLACPECRQTFRSELVLAEHRYHHHDAELPAHWARAEALAHQFGDA